MLNAAKNRRELIAAQFSRRDLIKMGLITSAGLLAPIKGLSARRSPGSNSVCVPSLEPASPKTRAFVEPLQIMRIAQPVARLDPAPTIAPNTKAGEQRTRDHQSFNLFPPTKLYRVSQHEAQLSMSPDLLLQRLWAFDDGNGPSFPGPTYVSRYGGANLVRNFNHLPENNGGFGLPSVSTHLHNGHTPSESDGFPCDFFERGHFYDQHYPNVLAGIVFGSISLAFSPTHVRTASRSSASWSSSLTRSTGRSSGESCLGTLYQYRRSKVTMRLPSEMSRAASGCRRLACCRAESSRVSVDCPIKTSRFFKPKLECWRVRCRYPRHEDLASCHELTILHSPRTL